MLPAKIIHHCRRTAARNLLRTGVPKRVLMAMVGHKTNSAFDRYTITSESELRQAAGKLADQLAGAGKDGSRAVPAQSAGNRRERLR